MKLATTEGPMPEKELKKDDLPPLLRCRMEEVEVVQDDKQQPQVIGRDGQVIPQCLPPGSLGYDL